MESRQIESNPCEAVTLRSLELSTYHTFEVFTSGRFGNGFWEISILFGRVKKGLLEAIRLIGGDHQWM